MRLLLCEDEIELSDALVEILKHHHYSVDTVYNGKEALEYLKTENYDAVILDIMMPKLDGIAVLQKIRSEGKRTPVIMVTAKSQIDDKVLGLDCGADDYVTKPFDTKELIARIRAVTRRAPEMTDNVLKFAGISLNRSTFELCGPEGIERLGNKEFQMLEMLLVHPSSVIPADTFMDRIWGYDSETENNIVWVYISYLRKKLAQTGADVRIRAVRNVGYTLEAANGKTT